MGNEENADFKKLIKQSIINDYWTAGFKAEVSFDTLLTPVIEEIVSTRYPNAIYVTKEFPVLRYNVKNFEDKNTDFSSINIDYLFYDNNTIYFVELKTSMDSVSKEQYENYSKINGKFEKYGRDFIRLLNHDSYSGIGDKNEIIKDFTSKNQAGLEELFKKIIKKQVSDHTEEAKKYTEEAKKYTEEAKDYLKKRNDEKKLKRNDEKKLKSSNKYLFQAGQILDCDIDWSKAIKVVYLVPETFEYEHKIIIQDALKQVKDNPNIPDNKKEYTEWLLGIFNEILGEKKTEENNAQN